MSQPRLLLVAPDAEPPQCTDVLEDWVRLPVTPTDRIARMRSLVARREGPEGSVPALHGDRTLEYRGARVDLSPIQAVLVKALIESFGSVVGRETLAETGWSGSAPSANNLDVAMARLRRELTAVGLRIRTVRSRGYVLDDAS
ncbi:MAG TPA: winged helix-turn-helix domain-containing protein [Acidimicrobiia bacterium]|nr:winged helix-turn-helix domain-containing protein [Acidimicrobiia bacterium]